MKRIAIEQQIRSHLESRLVLNAYILMAMRLFAGFSGFVFWAATARLMPPHEVGLASSVVSAAFLLASLGQLGFGYGLVRHLPSALDPSRLVNMTFMAVTGVALLLSVVFLGGLHIFSPALLPLNDSAEAMAAFLVLTVSTGLTQLLGWAFLARRLPVYTLYKNTLQAALGLVFLLPLALRNGDYLSALHAYTIATIISFLVAVVFFLPRVEPGYRFQPVLPATVRTPFTTYSLLNYLADQLSRAAATVIPLLVVNVLGTANAAYFFVVWSLAAGLSSLDEAVSSSFFAESSNDPDKVSDYTPKALKMGIAISALAAVGTLIVSRFVLMIYGADYVENSTLPLIVVAFALVPYSIVPVYTTFLRVHDRLLQVIIFSAIDIGLAIIFMYFAMVSGGVLGGTLGWLVSRIVLVLIIAPIWRRQTVRFRPTVKEVLDEQALG